MSLLAQGLHRAGFDVHICALTRGGPWEHELVEAGVPVKVIGKRWRLDLQAFWRLKQHVRRLKPDLIQTWLFAGNSYGRAAGLACGVKHMIACERCVDPWKSEWQFMIDRWLAKRTDRIVANSEAVRNFNLRFGLPADRFVVIPNGVAEPAPSRFTREEMLAELNLPPDAKTIGFVGRFWPQKRIKDAIWVADLVKVVRDDVHMLIFGDGPQRERLRIFRDQVHIRDRVHFLGQRNDVHDFLPHFDVLLSTSAYEGQSNTILEGMAAGVPVVASDIPGTRDLITDGETGFLAPVGDRAEFAGEVYRLLNEPELAGKIGAAARARALAEFSLNTMIQRFIDLYREVLG